MHEIEHHASKNAVESHMELSTSALSPLHRDHDYVACRRSKIVTISSDRPASVQAPSGGPGSRPTSRPVSAFWKMGHDTRRKLCIVGFNWNSSPLRLSRLDAAEKTATSAGVDADRTRPRDKSARSKTVLVDCDSSRDAECATRAIPGVKPEVVNAGGAKRRSKVYIYKPAASAHCAGARSTTAKPVALATKSSVGKTGSGNTTAEMSAEDETRAAVESVVFPDDRDFQPVPEVVPVPRQGGRSQRAGEYTIHLGPSKKRSADCGCHLSSLLHRTGSGIPPEAEMVEGGVQGTLSTAPLGIPSPFLLQTGLEQALGFGAFHPMSPSTSSSSCSRVACDDWINDDGDLTAASQAVAEHAPRRPTVLTPPDSWIGNYEGGDATAVAGFAPAAQPEAVFFDELSGAPIGSDGDLRYESSSFFVCEDNWDGYQREEQVDGCWPHQQHSTPPFGFGRKSAAGSRFRFTDTGIITSLGGGAGSGFGRAIRRVDRRRKQPEEKRNRKSAYDDVTVMPEGDGPEVVSASKKSCRRRLTYGEGPKRATTTTAIAHELTEATADVDADVAQKAPSRRRKQPAASKKKTAAASDNALSDGANATPKAGGSSRRKGISKTSRGQQEVNIKSPTSTAVRLSVNPLNQVLNSSDIAAALWPSVL